ncbi:MAG: glycosyl transferase family protein [uncultured bacterium]|uniref:Glycosyl transferase family 2 n=4 Tax=Candidatus Daviesiibacteriota TaxID=1752718 RepID=A0A0G0HV16_9BACT|nr:MAG: glycosyl transferase family protein [uncultured bacterium]KKQ07716.1 MAG: Glycosyl transferase family 2 [Candidatus Daviesbacteria bacterium GW2011_GWB1_36_5]KKQ15448.1 MAG: Glycosyl transferase family 2 [Candidatus Daviesbacteria bacterium GW2011_GWA1_36_8]OGE17458.1 MAG: hypothetical protein A2858_00940 [Candidatus Daviesbacteria bacterium RIFCSPHIGHO2_01_FULL_36_37]OGE36553.1 MAG: hypothetical protein A3E66_02785 [Candidatus Daviesbacteria bacterium RIFCSPHIGHO2_12_FULL_37_16]
MRSIWGHMLVKNEDKFIYFAILSVIDYIEKLLIYDTGSTDKTVKVIKLFKEKYPNKITFEQYSNVDAKKMTELRQKMLDKTKSDWFLLIDGDEVWWESSIMEVVKQINSKGEDLYALVNPVINLVGDIYHYQEEEAGNYNILGKKGHFNVRVINRKIKGLYLKDEYPLEGYYDGKNRLIQSVDEKLLFIDEPILHFSHLSRSSVSYSSKETLHRQKYKYELGKKFKEGFKYPEVFYREKPDFIGSPWNSSSAFYKFRAGIETPLRKLKRKFAK